MKEPPPSRGGNQKLYASQAAGYSYGRGSKRGRGNFSGHNKSLQQQIHEEIDRQLHFSDNQGPYHTNPKRGKSRQH